MPISRRVYLAGDDDEQRAKAGLDRFFAARYPWMIQKNPDFYAAGLFQCSEICGRAG